jgi:thioredoxin reductase
VPRLVTGRFRTLEEAEQVLREGAADIVSMVRAHIADPFIVAKTRAGLADRVRPCIACNQGCVGGAMRTGKIGCAVNATVGAEATLSESAIACTSKPKTVLVIGGGPGGMEAARIAAHTGHKVILAEATPDLGGLVQVAKRAPKLHTLGDATDWLEREIYRLGVDVRLNTYMELDDVRAVGADAIIVATGSTPRMDGFQVSNPGRKVRGVDQPHVLSSVDLLSDGGRDPGQNALVVDNVGHYEAVAAAEHLLSRGVAVTFLTHSVNFAPFVELSWRAVPALERFYATGRFSLLTRHMLVEVRRKDAIVRPLEAGANQTATVAADTVVIVTPNTPVRSLYDELRDEHADITVVGDARAPRDVQAAIAEGHLAARALA